MIGVICNRLLLSPTEHPCDRHSQSTQADAAVFHFTRRGWWPVWHGKWWWVSCRQFQTFSFLPTLRPPHWNWIRPHWLFPGGEAPSCLWVCRCKLLACMCLNTFSTLVLCFNSISCFLSSTVGVVGGTSCLMPDVSGVWVNVMSKRYAVWSWSFVCFTTVEMRTSRVSSGSSSHLRKTGVNPQHYSTTLVGGCA